MQATNRYKQIIYIIGTTACGKTTTAQAFRYIYLADVISADKFYDFAGPVYDRPDYAQLTRKEEWANYPDMSDWKKKWYRFQLEKFRNSGNRTLVVEGATLGYTEEREIVESLVDAPSIMVLLEPSNWRELYMKKHSMRPAVDMVGEYRKTIEGEYVVVNNLEELTQPLGYQRVGFTDLKWQALKLGDVHLKSMLDLGCSAGWFNMYVTGGGVGRYVGVDNYWRNIVKARSDHYGEYILGDIGEYLCNCKEKFDIVVMASALHYFENKKEIIKLVSEVTEGVFVLEMPVHESEDGDKEGVEFPVKGQTYTIPTEKMVLAWLGEYFKKVEVVGQSVPPDNSYRLVFKGWK
jgi:2-polyprenyl-3-methyl-5-hydroxy-6-metoxy-1,4-benzoquinol methylase